MKKALRLGAIIWSALIFSGFNVYAEESSDMSSKILIAYYSYSGNTKEVAEAIQKETGGVLFEIKADDSYPDDYHAMTAQAKREIEEGYRPELTTEPDNIDGYDTVFVGSPNWWGTITPQVSSFLQKYKLSGKKVIPFITHGGGGVQNTVKDLAAQCRECAVSDNPWVGYGSRTMGISSWVKKVIGKQ